MTPFSVRLEYEGIEFLCLQYENSQEHCILFAFRYNGKTQLIPYRFDTEQERDEDLDEMDVDWIEDVYQEFKIGLN